MNDKRDGLQWARKNFDIRKTSQEHKDRSSSGTIDLVAEKPPHICYQPQLPPGHEQHKRNGILLVAIVSAAPHSSAFRKRST
jgi:hypothetical protein